MPGINTIEGDNTINGAKIAIVASRYNGYIVERLIKGCIDTLAGGGVSETEITMARVPGAFELPMVAGRLARQGKYDAVIALGAVIRGETPHFDYICNECAHGLAKIAIKTDMPVIFGVLTADTAEQAEDRSGDEESNKGSEAAQTAIEMISLLRKIG